LNWATPNLKAMAMPNRGSSPARCEIGAERPEQKGVAAERRGTAQRGQRARTGLNLSERLERKSHVEASLAAGRECFVARIGRSGGN